MMNNMKIEGIILACALVLHLVFVAQILFERFF